MSKTEIINTNEIIIKKKINRLKNIDEEINLMTSGTEKINLNKDEKELSDTILNNDSYIINSTIKYINKYLDDVEKQNLSNYMYCITNKLKGDGAGLSSGTFIDMLICEFFSNKLKKCEEYHNGECDIKINGEEFSLKKINGKSSLALDWSKNNENSIKKEFFTHNIILINTKTSQWWKKNPKNINIDDKTNYTREIKPAIYIINKNYCKKNIKLSSNNKSNSIINEQYVYKIICKSIDDKTYIELPEKNKEFKFNLLKCFTD